MEVRPSLDPVSRALQDAAALCADDKLPALVAARVVPGLCRVALEAFLVDNIRTRELERGAHHDEVDGMLDQANSLTKKAALALFGDADRGGDVFHQLNTLGRRGGDTYRQLKEGAHDPGTIRPEAVLADTRWLIGRLPGLL